MGRDIIAQSCVVFQGLGFIAEVFDETLNLPRGKQKYSSITGRGATRSEARGNCVKAIKLLEKGESLIKRYPNMSCDQQTQDSEVIFNIHPSGGVLTTAKAGGRF